MVEITIEVSKEEFDKYYQESLLLLSKNLEIKGFRKGNVPLEIAKKNINPTDVLNEATQNAVKESYLKVVKEEELNVIDKAEIEILKIALDDSFSFKAKVSVLPEIELSDYKKISSSLKKKEVSVEEKEIEDALNWLSKYRSKFTALNREARKGDFVEIEYSSPSIEGGAKKEDSFVLDKGNFVPGFEDKIKGMKGGEEKEFSLLIPKDYFIKELAGKDVNFKAKLKSVLKMEKPEINDEFAKSLGKFDNLDSLRKNIREGLIIEKESKEKQRHRGEILEKIQEKIEWDLPKGLVEAEKQRIFESFKNSFSGQMSFQDYLKKVKKTEQEIKESFDKNAQNNIKSFIILREIAKKENLKVEEKEIEEEVNKIIGQYPDKDSVEKNLDLDKIKQYTKERIISEKAFNLLEDCSKK